jgi:SAM-dependent methyltransferase
MINSSFNEYKEAISILENTSKHPSLIEIIIKNKILPKLSQRNRLLDVGAGAGKITKTLQNQFDEIVAIEINPKLQDAYAQTKIKLYNCDFMKAELKEKFDLVICSHVMYHLDKSKMQLFINKLLSVVASGGYCFIALMASRGQNHEFHKAFNPNYINSNQIITILNEQQIKYKRIEAHNLFTTDNVYSMRSLLRFFALEDCQTHLTKNIGDDEIKRIDAIVEKQSSECSKENGFELQQEEDYFIIPGL